MKYKDLIICLATIITVTILFQSDNKINNIKIAWIKDLNYKESQIHDMSIGIFNPCPSIPVKIGGQEVKLEFDTGNAGGIALTTALKGKVEYDVIGKSTQLNADGTYRGEGDSVLLKSINVFGETYSDVSSTLTDWRMYGFFKFNGTIGLENFKNKIVTLDYRNKKIAVSSEALDYSKLKSGKYTILPLISIDSDNYKNLIFFQGEVNGQKSTIYLDTGSTRSFLNFEDNKTATAEVTIGDKKFKLKRFKNDKIGFTYNFEYPLRLAINSDMLKADHFVITIGKIQSNLIIYQN